MQPVLEKKCAPAAAQREFCPVRDVLDRIGDKWSLLVLLHLGTAEALRFNELRKRATGISQRMLTVTLRSLEADGLLTRHVYAEVPPRVEYRLTALGHGLRQAIGQLEQWARTNGPQIEQARAAYAAVTDRA